MRLKITLKPRAFTYTGGNLVVEVFGGTAFGASSFNPQIAGNFGFTSIMSHQFVQNGTSGCVGTNQIVSVTVVPTPTMTSASSASICSGGNVSVFLTSNVTSSYT